MEARAWVYLRWTLGVFAATLLLTASCNLLIDPSGVFGAPRIAGVNAIKPYLDHHRELARWKAARRLCGNAAIFGNSRAEIGFDPTHPAFRARGLTAFNHAIPGSGIGVAVRQLGWLRQAGCAPQTVVVGVEFFDFLGSGAAGAGGAGGVPRQPEPAVDLPFLAETVFSLTGLKDSLATVALQRAPYPATITPQGFNPLLAYIPEVEKSGHYLLFRQRAEENLKNWQKKAPRLAPPGGGPSADQAGLEAFLAEAAQSAREVDLVIYPYHTEIRLMMERLGLAGLFADWKRSLVATAGKYAAPGVAVRVWDFSGIHPYTLEAIPARGDRRVQLQWYWEAGHFKKALGDRVLARVLGEEFDFGRALDGGNVDTWLAEDRTQVQALLAQPSPLLDEVDDVVRVRGARP